MPGSAKWTRAVADALVEWIGEEEETPVEFAIELVQRLRAVPGANSSAQVTLERLEEELQSRREGGNR